MTSRLLVIIAAGLGLASCSTVQLPNLGMDLPEFRESIDNLDSAYPQAEDLPGAPEGVRSASQWDQAAREMQSLRARFDLPELEPALSDDAFEREFRAAQDYADAYKDDDPQ